MSLRFIQRLGRRPSRRISKGSYPEAVKFAKIFGGALEKEMTREEAIALGVHNDPFDIRYWSVPLAAEGTCEPDPAKSASLLAERAKYLYMSPCSVTKLVMVVAGIRQICAVGFSSRHVHKDDIDDAFR